MAIAPYRTSTDIFRPFFDDLFANADPGRMGGLMRAPLADVVETETEIKVIAEMPGLTPSDLQLDIENNVLTIAGEKQEERRSDSDGKSKWHLTERRYGQFSRSFVLPRDVDQEGIQASFENGILTVVIPKSERARRRRIEVKGDRGPTEVRSSS